MLFAAALFVFAFVFLFVLLPAFLFVFVFVWSLCFLTVVPVSSVILALAPVAGSDIVQNALMAALAGASPDNADPPAYVSVLSYLCR